MAFFLSLPPGTCRCCPGLWGVHRVLSHGCWGPHCCPSASHSCLAGVCAAGFGTSEASEVALLPQSGVGRSRLRVPAFRGCTAEAQPDPERPRGRGLLPTGLERPTFRTPCTLEVETPGSHLPQSRWGTHWPPSRLITQTRGRRTREAPRPHLTRLRTRACVCPTPRPRSHTHSRLGAPVPLVPGGR